MNHRTPSRRPAFTRIRQQAFTLIEILVALTITLIMMGAVVTLFGVMADSVADSRALIETSDRLRACRNRLQADLQGVTASMKPPLSPENDEGYFEVSEGRGGTAFGPTFASDSAPGTANTNLSLFGDCDDVLMLTTRSTTEPFVGKVNGNAVEGQVAEVVYYLRQDGPLYADGATQMFTLYRRQLLVLPGVTTAVAGDDIALQNGTTTANSLGDLSKPANRFSHGASFPSTFSLPAIRLDDVLLTNVLAFDVQVWDPGAPLTVSGSLVLEQRDKGYNPSGTLAANGSYVDLGYTFTPATPPTPAPVFNNVFTPSATPPVFNPNWQSWTTTKPTVAPPATQAFTYDTWSTHYLNGGATGTDFSSTDGIDTDGNGVVDDVAEANSGGFLPPYTAPLRGVRITIRVYEPSSQQVREVTVVQDFSTQ